MDLISKPEGKGPIIVAAYYYYLFIYLALLFIAFEAILNLGFMLSILLNIKVCNVAILEISSTLF